MRKEKKRNLRDSRVSRINHALECRPRLEFVEKGKGNKKVASFEKKGNLTFQQRDMEERVRERPSSLTMMDSPSLDARLVAEGGRNLLDEGDDSGFMNFTSKDLDKMNLVDTPPVHRKEKKPAAHLSSPSKTTLTKRPSWGPKSSPMKEKMRLLEGLEEAGSPSQPRQVKRKERTLGVFGQDNRGSLRPRQSIFVKPTFMQNHQDDAPERVINVEKDEEGDDSFYKNSALSSSTNSVKGRVAAIEAGRVHAEAGSHVPQINGSESKEQMDSQLLELKKMNGVFEAYERMLTGSADQIEVSLYFVCICLT